MYYEEMEAENDPLTRAFEERVSIFQKYDQGVEVGNIDPWENPNFEIYASTDKYGFIHDKPLPKQFDPNKTKIVEIELARELKWLKMLKFWEKNKKKLIKRTFKGIPNKLRSEIWKKFLHVNEEMNKNKGIYEKMLYSARKFCTETRQIDSDVNRQFRDNVAFRERYSIKQKSLFNVLTAYSMYNMELGYCQGMAGLTGVFLLYMDEEEAFWALNSIISDEKYAMHGFFIEGFPKLTRFLEHHDKIVAKFLSKLHKHFLKNNLDSILYTLKWFFVVFIERIPYSLCLRVWDVYLLIGESVITAMALTILRLHQNKLLKLKDMDLIIEYLQVKLQKNFGYNEDHVMKILDNTMFILKKYKLDLPPPGNQIEFAQKPFGKFIEPDYERKTGRRKSVFTENEKRTLNNMILRQDTATDETQSNFSFETTDISAGDALSVRTFQSINSLATSVALSETSTSSNEDSSGIDFPKAREENTRL